MTSLLTHSEHRNFQRLWLAQLISQFGDRINQLALVGLIAERAPGSTLGLAKLMAFTIIPVFIIQPFAGVFIDRWDRRTTLFVCDIIRGLLVLSIPLVFIYWPSIIQIYIVVFFAFCFSRFYVPAKMSIIPDLVQKDHLLTANSLMTMTGMMATGLGAALGAFIIEYWGAKNGFLIDAGTFFFSALLLSGMTLPWRWTLKIDRTKIMKAGKEIRTLQKSFWTEFKEGIQYLARRREIWLVLSMLFVLFSAAGAAYIVVIVFIQQSFGSVTRDLGILAIFLVLGLMGGVLAYGKWGTKARWFQTISWCLILGGTMLSIFAISVGQSPKLSTAIVLAFIFGLTIGPIFVATNTTVHIVSNDEMRGKVFSALEIVMHFAFLIAMLLGSWASKFVGAMSILIAVGGMCVVAGLLGLLRKKGLEEKI